MANRKKLVLFDGHALLHRGFHAIPFLSTKDGTPTNGVFGFTTIMLKALAEIKPDYVAVGWDMHGPTFRHKMYKDYKGTRAKIDDNLLPQIETTREVIAAFNIPLIEKKGYEADDVIGAIAKAHNKELDVIIVTGDMDELQLVDEHVQVYTMRRGFTDTVLYDIAAVVDKYGVTPEEFVVFKALKGDSSDNIPGVAGIGDKTATELVSAYKTLDGIYKHLDELRPAVAAKLRDSRDIAELSLELSRIKTDISTDFNLKNAHINDYDKAKVHDLFTKLQFKSLLAKLPGKDEITELGAQTNMFDANEPRKAKPERAHLKNAKYINVDSEQKLEALIKKLLKSDNFAFDTETDSLDIINANLVGMSFSVAKGEAYYVPVGHKKGNQLPLELVLERLKPILENAKRGKIGHNIKFDYEILRRYGVELGPIVMDTMVAAFLINPMVRALSLSELAYNELGIEMVEITELIGPKGKNQKTFADTEISEAVVYAAEDADMAWRLYEVLRKELIKTPKLKEMAAEMEWPVIPVLGKMERTGVKVDVKFLAEFAKKIDAMLEKLQNSIWKEAGEHFNISSTQQLKVILFDKLKIDTTNLKKIKTGISTAASELEKLRGVHPIIEMLFEYREVTKLKNTYVDTLPKLVNPTTGRIHTSYNQTIAQTGRLSSTNPNLQNIPIRTPLGAEVRNAFVAERGKVFVSADYSQIELRLAAALAKDKEMIEAFRRGDDIHALTAAQLFEVPLEKVTKEQRYAAKTINFGILYGMNPHGLSVATGMDYAQAKEFIDKYFEIRKGVADYIEHVKKQAHKDLYTETIFGRRRPCPDVKSNNFIIRSSAERAAVNMPLQGTAADMMKLAMVRLDAVIGENAKILLQIHDELIVECDKAVADSTAKLMQETMGNVHKFDVPIEVNTKIGKSWGDL